ncbi:hypothetical protein [endosymbiont GvMRE of Glomus versiforme]|uniref:hypothetical protein n=1 Tax=endosymbiont GvMRE of Glomus versiforme TaxID=2039283 RepID=UPI000EBBA99D|nr:hypothetical protein [endosymbiont GvMRE of Glomus versiforme]RHZ37441.1 hypothetical protein GvMRE_I1g135 [endosymbiont GvMRE of Glomus versiforme]
MILDCKTCCRSRVEHVPKKFGVPYEEIEWICSYCLKTDFDQLEIQFTTEQKKVVDLQKQTKALTLLANSRKEALEREKQALIQIANKKLTNQKEAKQLLKELQEKWNKEKTELTQENQDLTKDKKNLSQTKENQAQRILALEADKQDLIKQLTQAKTKHQNHLTKEKSLLQKEIKLIKEALYE